jgi:phage gpG-like protein
MAKTLPSALSGSYIKTTFGGINYDTPGAAFDALGKDLEAVQDYFGELTPLFNNVAEPLIDRIKARFDDGSLNKKPFAEVANTRRSKFTRLARVNPNGPTLKDTGRLQRSIKRLKSPTKTSKGEQREVSVLRIGTLGVPYAEKHLFGGTFEIEGWEKELKNSTKFFTNFDKMNFANGKTNRSEYTPRQLKMLTSLPEATKVIEIPIRDFLKFDAKTDQFVADKVNEFMIRLVKEMAR